MVSLLLLIGGLLSSSPIVHQNKEILCLAKNIYYEARAEPIEGLFAVAEVTNNRINSELFTPTTHCGVVYQPKQFSWVSNQYAIKEHEMWDRSTRVAVVSYYFGNVLNVVPEALFFHSGKQTKYFKTLNYVGTIGGHSFYTKG